MLVLDFNTLRSLFHKLAQARKMNPHTPADAGCLELAIGHVAPEGSVRKPAVALGLRVADPLLLYRLLQRSASFSVCS